MIIKSFTFNPFSTNCYVVTSENDTVIVDPSCHSPEEMAELKTYISDAKLQITRILLTHAHIDHIFGCAELSRTYGVGIEVHADEQVLLDQAAFQSQMFRMELEQPPKPVSLLIPGESVTFGANTWEILHTPGHSPGSVSFFDSNNGIVISGDVLFQNSIGRTDLWRGSLPILMDSIFNVLLPLGDSVRVLPGHGPETLLGREKAHNPFLADFGPMGS